jgi:hypothetical protein
MNRDWNRSMKNAAREIAMSYSGPKRSVVMLPGWDCLCVKTALRKGLFDRDTGGVLVERDQLTFGRVVQNCRPLMPQVQFYEGQLHHLTVYNKVDYAFLDFTNPLTPEIAHWLARDLSPQMLPEGNIAMTFAYATRGNRFMVLLRDFFKATKARRKFCWDTSFETSVSDYKALVYIAALKLIFLPHNVKFDNCVKYHDHNPMLLFMMSNFDGQRRMSAEDKEIRGEFMTFTLENIERRCEMAASSPGKKAAATRAAKAREEAKLAARRSAAAHKAVATRRARGTM